MLTNNATEKILPALRSGRPEAILQGLDTIHLFGHNNLRTWRELRRLCRHANDAVAYRAGTALAALYRRGTGPAMTPIVRLAPRFAAREGDRDGATLAGGGIANSGRIDLEFARARGPLFQNAFREVHASVQSNASGDANAARVVGEYWRSLLVEMGAGSTETLVWLLGQGDAAAEFALGVLSEIGVPAVAAVPAVETIQSGDASFMLKLRACLALARLQPRRADESALQLLDFLRSPDLSVRRIAIEALNGIRHNLDRVVPAVATAYFSKNESALRDAGRECLTSMGTAALPELLRFLAGEIPGDASHQAPTEPPEKSISAADILELAASVSAAHGAGAIRTILADSPHTNLPERRLTTAVIREVLKRHPDDLNELCAWCAQNAARTLELLQAFADLHGLPAKIEREIARPFILSRLESAQDIELRVTAIHALSGRLEDENLIEDCIPWLSDEDFRVRESAATVLGTAGPLARRAIQPLLNCLKDETIEVRGSAATALAKISPDAGAMFPDLMGAFHLRESQETAGERAGFHLLQHLSDKLADPNPRIVERTLEKIASLGHRGLGLLPALGVCLRNEDLWVRARTLEILMAYGELAGDLKQEVRALYSDPDWYVRQLVMQCLPALGDGGDALPVLLEAAHGDPHEDVRKEAVRSLGLLGAHARTAAPELVRLLADGEQADLHEMAGWSLDRIKATMNANGRGEPTTTAAGGHGAATEQSPI